MRQRLNFELYWTCRKYLLATIPKKFVWQWVWPLKLWTFQFLSTFYQELYFRHLSETARTIVWTQLSDNYLVWRSNAMQVYQKRNQNLHKSLSWVRKALDLQKRVDKDKIRIQENSLRMSVWSMLNFLRFFILEKCFHLHIWMIHTNVTIIIDKTL